MNNLTKDNKKKIVIGTSLKEVNTVLKDYVLKNKQIITNVESETLSSLAVKLLKGHPSYKDYRFLDNNEANATFYSFLSNNMNGMIFGLIPKESFSFATSTNSYETINKVRTGYVKGKTHDLVEIITKFEEYLLSKEMLDEVLAMRKACELIKKNKAEAIQSIGYGNNVSLYILPSLTNKMTYLEKHFLELLEDLFAKSNIISWNKSYSITENKKIATFGYSNSIKFIVQEIIDKKYNLNDVAVYTSCNSYNALLKAYFDNYNIQYCFENGDSASSEDIIGFFNTTLDFLANHFNIEYLYNLYKNPALAVYEDGNGVHSYAYTCKLKNLHADKEQILKEIEQYTPQRQDFIKDLLALYDEKNTVGAIYQNVLEFVLNYTNDLSHRYCKQPLEQLIKFFKLMDGVGFNSFKDKVDLIKQTITSIKIDREIKENSSYILINSIDATYLPRKYNFFIGLSAEELLKNEIESPLLSDENLKSIIDDKEGYVSYAKKQNEELAQHIKDLLQTQSEGTNYFIVSTYDSVNCKELAKSSIYFQLPGNEIVFLGFDNDINAKLEAKPEYLFPQSKKAKIDKTNLSASNIEKLMKCPLEYIYSKIYEEIELDQYEGRWLKGGDEGTFAHVVLEKYFRKNKDKNTFIKANFDVIFKDVYEEAKKNNPFSNSNIQDYEASKVKKMCEEYLIKYYSNLTSYKPIYFELKIEENDNVQYPDVPNFKIHGIIDRVDAYVDENKELHVRIIDYKTYSENSYKDHNENKTLPQMVLYPIMMNWYINKHLADVKKQVGDFDVKDKYDIVFKYEMLKYKEDFKVSAVDVQTKINDVLNHFKDLRNNPTVEEFMKIYKPKITAKTEHDEGICKYCKFVRYCKFKMCKGDNQIWKK